MGTARMSQTSDQAESDDLIAELARLMAEDAKGSSNAKQGSSDQAKHEQGGVDTITRPTGRSPSDRLSATRKTGSLYNDGEHPAGDAKPAPRDEISDRLAGHLQDRDKAFEADTLGEIHSITTGKSRAIESDTPATGRGDVPRDPIAELIAAQLEHAAPPAEDPEPETSFKTSSQSSDRFGGEPPHPAEDDTFNEPPVFGVNTAGRDESRSTAKRSSDPLEEIESLIGDAVRVGNLPEELVEPEESVKKKPRTGEDLNDAAAAAEAAILAATAESSRGVTTEETGSAVDELQEAIARQHAAPEPELDADEVVEHKRSLGQRLVGPLVAAGLLVAIGGGLYWMFGNGVIDDGEAPVLTADSAPVKEDPEPEVGNTAEPARSIVFDELSGENTGDEPAQLVSRDQTDGVAGNDVARVITPENVAETIENGVAAAENVASDAIDDGIETIESGLANRKVRTVTVLPDGTIVSGDDAVAGGEVLPVDRPNVPDLPAEAETVASELADTPIVSETPSSELTASNGNLQALQPVDEALPAETVLETPAVGAIDNTIDAPIPRPRPLNRAALVGVENLVTNSVSASPQPTSNEQAVDLIANIANQAVSQPAQQVQTQPIQPQPTQVASAAPLVDTSSAPAYVQLSSRRSEETAQSSLQEIQSRHGSILSGGPLEIQRVDLGEKGIYFRVRMPASTIEQANSVCSNVKLNGGDCFVRTN